MLFNAGEHAIELLITSEPAKSHLKGQVLGEGFAGAELTLSSKEFFKKSRIGEMSEFDMLDVPKGFYTLTVRSNEREIVIEDVDI
jgi:hypothetical protein